MCYPGFVGFYGAEGREVWEGDYQCLQDEGGAESGK